MYGHMRNNGRGLGRGPSLGRGLRRSAGGYGRSAARDQDTLASRCYGVDRRCRRLTELEARRGIMGLGQGRGLRRRDGSCLRDPRMDGSIPDVTEQKN